METHFMLAALSWWEISGVRPVFVGEKMGGGGMEKWNGERVETDSRAPFWGLRGTAECQRCG